MSKPRIQGRYKRPSSNLSASAPPPEFERFVDVDPSAGPRSTGSTVSVLGVDMMQTSNKSVHHTDRYATSCLVVRRGFEFQVQITFNIQVTDQLDFLLEFYIGASPCVNDGTKMVVGFGPSTCSSGCSWTGRVVQYQGNAVTVGITPSAKSIVGKFSTYVAIKVDNGFQRTPENLSLDVYVLFNAWCPDDVVYMSNEDECYEYVLNDSGVIFQGTTDYVSHRLWAYGQFEDGILDACITILDACELPIKDRHNVIKVVRVGSSLMNAQDNNGVLTGNWTESFVGGTAPTSWTGSASILQKYRQTGSSVCYGQCWVFAGVFNTVLRCIGIPSRVITNFNSAHDNDGNLNTDMVFNLDGTPNERETRDSIWNYHCWNEIFCQRTDEPEHSGWQVVDATPQETSGGYFQCGPAPVSAIKNGDVSVAFDTDFCFAEVNSNVVCKKMDRYGNLTPYYTDYTMVGAMIYTKALHSNSFQDITNNYKHPQDSAGDKASMANAMSRGMLRDDIILPTGNIHISIEVEQATLGKDVVVNINFHNEDNEVRNIKGDCCCWGISYTGYPTAQCMKVPLELTVQPHEVGSVTLTATVNEYLSVLISQPCLTFTVTGDAAEQLLTAIKAIVLATPPLNVAVFGLTQVGQQMYVTVTFTNPFDFELSDMKLTLDGAGLMNSTEHKYQLIEANGTISWTLMFQPRLWGKRVVIAVLDGPKLTQVWGYVEFDVVPSYVTYNL